MGAESKKLVITSKICEEILKKKLQENFGIINYTVKDVEEKTGFLGEYLKLQIFVRTSNGEEVHYFFVKVVPQTGFSDFVVTAGSFQNERFMFENIFSKMEKLGILLHDCVPRCFYSEENRIIIFEDMNHYNFQVANKHETFNYEELKLLIKKLAKFHGSSLVLEERCSTPGSPFRIDQKFGGCIKETNYVKIDNHLGYEAVKSAIKGALKMIDHFANPTSITKEEMKEMMLQFYEDTMYQQCAPSKKYRNVFCHGDLWANNIMLQYVEQKLVDCRFVDFQNVRICPPAHDVLTLIYVNTTYAFREKHFQELLLVYHLELSSFLQSHGCQPTILPLEEFLECCEEFKIFAINFAVTLLPIVMLNAGEMEKLFQDKELTKHVMFVDRGDFILEVADRDERYRKLLEESMKDLTILCENLKKKSCSRPQERFS